MAFTEDQQPGDREIIAGPNVKSLGLRLTGNPPDPILVVSVDQGEFGFQQGVRRNDEVIAINGFSVKSLDPAEKEPMLRARPCRLLIRSSGYEEPVNSFASLPREPQIEQFPRQTPSSPRRAFGNQVPPVPGPSRPLSFQTNPGDSPRGAAHNALLQALMNHDGSALAEALALAKVAGITGPGLEAAQQALESLGGRDGIGPEQRRGQVMARLIRASSGSDVTELRTAIEEAVEAGVESGFDQAEQALNRLRNERARALDMLVSLMEQYVISLESNDGAGAEGAIQDELKMTLEHAKKAAGSEDQELLTTAQRLVAFAEGREKALRELEAKVEGHAVAMERIADAAEAELNKDYPGQKSAVASLNTRASDAARGRLSEPLQITPAIVPAAPSGYANETARSPRAAAADQGGETWRRQSRLQLPAARPSGRRPSQPQLPAQSTAWPSAASDELNAAGYSGNPQLSPRPQSPAPAPRVAPGRGVQIGVGGAAGGGGRTGSPGAGGGVRIGSPSQGGGGVRVGSPSRTPSQGSGGKRGGSPNTGVKIGGRRTPPNTGGARIGAAGF